MDDVKTTETQDSTEETKVESTETTASEQSETTQVTGELSTEIAALQKTVNHIAAKDRKGEVDAETLQIFNASVARLAELQKPTEAPEDSERIAALEMKVADGEHALKVQEIKTTYGLSDSDMDLISDPDLEKFEKRAIEIGKRNKLSNRREASGVFPEGIAGNPTAERLKRQTGG